MGRDRFIKIIVIFISVLIIATLITNQYGHSQQRCCGMMNQNHMEMMQEMMSGRLPPGIEPEDLPDPESEGAKLLLRYCTQCHNLPSPAMHTSEEWPDVAQRMFSRLRMMSGMREEWMGMMWMKAPSAEEQEIIVAYLKAHSLKPMTPGSLPTPESPGAISFKNTCSQCHALPDPKLHTAEEWSGVVERMRVNMQTMGKPVISKAEKEKIVSYLSQNTK